MDSLLKACKVLARQAGAAIMEIYNSGDFETEFKVDSSPLTKADKIANSIIEAGLYRISSYPVVSEEGSHHTNGGKEFWLVDPIDGTKEFIKRNGEFTVNIALVRDGVPTLGVVYVPAQKLMYYGSAGESAYKQQDNEAPIQIFANYNDPIPTVVASRSHLNEATQAFLARLGECRLVSMGSSLKLCLVAEGKATVYPRLAPTLLWDTAAADAVVRAAGGTVTDLDGNTMTYEPEKSMLNPYFLVSAKDKDYRRFLKQGLTAS